MTSKGHFFFEIWELISGLAAFHAQVAMIGSKDIHVMKSFG